MRQRDPLTPEQERELDALERALAGDPVAFDLRELEELVLDVRATAPQMSPAFAARLEHEVAEGFPTPREHPPLRARRPGRRWVLLPGAGVLAAALIALVVVLGGSGHRSDDAMTPAMKPAEPSARETAPSTAAAQSGAGTAADSAASAPDPSASTVSPARARKAAPAPSSAGSSGSYAGGVVTQARTRKVQRSAVLVIQTSDGTFDATTDRVIATVGRFGGIVASSQIGDSDAAGGEATFDLRIPTGRLDQALAALSKLGHVTERSQELQDITASFSSAQERLDDARAERRGLLRALARATTPQQIDAIKGRLRSVGGRIASLKSQIAALRRRADLSTVALTVRGGGSSEPGAGGGADGGDWTPGDAAGDALRVLEVLAGVALVAFAILVPLGLCGLAVGLGIRLARRRRREAALDPA